MTNGYRIMWLLPRPPGGQLVLLRHIKCIRNDYRGRYMQKHGKFYCHSCRTRARLTKNRLTRFVLRQLAKMMFPRLHCIAESSQFISWQYCSGTMTTILLPSNFNDLHTYKIHIPAQLQAHTQPESSCATEKRLEQVQQSLEKYVQVSMLVICMLSGQQKLEHQIITQVCGFCQPHSWMVSCPTVHSDGQPVSSGNQCTYINTIMPISSMQWGIISLADDSTQKLHCQQ